MIRADVASDMQRASASRARTGPDAGSDDINSGHLRAYIERIERVEAEIADLNQDKKEIYKEARGNGFDPKIIKKVVGIRRIDPEKRVEEETLVDLYLAAIREGGE